MAKDDYDVVLFKILSYLYGCIKRKYSFDITSFNAVISKQKVNDDYLSSILHMASEEGLVEGLTFTHAWGMNYIVCNDYSDMTITAKGIRYLKDNSKMQEVKKYLEEIPGIVADLIRLVF